MPLLPFDPAPLEALTIDLEGWRARLDARGPLVRAWAGQLRRDLEASSIAASTGMEGVRVTADEVRRILAGDAPATVSESDVDLVEGYRDAMRYILRRADDPNFAWNRELLVGVHDRVLAGKFALGAGRYRQGPVEVINQTTGDVIFTPPAFAEVPELVDKALAQLSALSAHASVKAAWIHVAVAAIHPFRDGNGRTARVVASLAMYRDGFKRPEFCSLEEWWGRHLADYYAAFNCLGRAFDTSSDVTPFLLAHLRAQIAQAESLFREEQIGRLLWTALENVCVDARLPPRVANALYDAFHERSVTAGYYRSLADVSPATATSDMRAAVAARLLSAVGQRRGRTYVAGSRLFDEVRAALGVTVVPHEEANRVGILNDISGMLRGGGIAAGSTISVQTAAPSERIVTWNPPASVSSLTRSS